MEDEQLSTPSKRTNQDRLPGVTDKDSTLNDDQSWPEMTTPLSNIPRLRPLVLGFENRSLAQVVAYNPNLRVMIATRGFEFIVKPMVRHLSLRPERVVGCRFWQGGADRQQGKEQLLERYVSASELGNAVLVTDSLDDASLLNLVQYPLWVQWPQAQYRPALANSYLPFFYLERVKRPGAKYTWNVIVKNHWLGLLLALIWLSPSPIIHGLGITSLLIAFWCIYEVGYFG